MHRGFGPVLVSLGRLGHLVRCSCTAAMLLAPEPPPPQPAVRFCHETPFVLREELLATDFDSHREQIFLALRAIFNLCTVHGQSVTLPDRVRRRFRLIPVHVHHLPNPLPLGLFFDSRLPAFLRPGGLLCLFSSPSPSLFSIL